MSGRKKKYKQRGPSNELLNELSSLRDLLGSDDIGEIPLLDQIAEPGRPQQSLTPAPQKPRPPARQQLLDETDLPILFSPVDEELPDGHQNEVNEPGPELSRPLQNFAPSGRESPMETVQTNPKPPAQQEPKDGRQAPPASSKLQEQPQVTGTEEKTSEQSASGRPIVQPKSKENPFLPPHIRARLTGGRAPGEAQAIKPPPGEASSQKQTLPEAGQLAPGAETTAQETTAATAQADRKAAGLTGNEFQRKQLVDHLVAKQLPELERQLRARIEKMLDELLEAKS